MAPPKATPTATLDESTDFSEVWYGGGARAGLISLLLVTVLFAGGALFAKFNLEAFRTQIEERLEEQMGAELRTGHISVNGFRGIRIEQLELDVQSDSGPRAFMSAPHASININLTNLLYGEIHVDEIVLDEARFLIERPEDTTWYSGEAFDLEELLSLPSTSGFRVIGRNCTIEILNVVGTTRADISDFNFDVVRPPGATDMTASLEGNLSGDANQHLNVRLTMSSLEDFGLRVQATNVTPEAVNVFLPSEHQFVTNGKASPTFWIDGRPGQTLLVTMETPFENLTIRDQPDFLDPAEGMLTVHATYSIQDNVLSVTTAKAESDQLGGALEGSVSFATMYPTFDLRLKATRLPVEKIVSYALEGEPQKYGEMQLTVSEPHELILALQGTSDEPQISGNISADSGELKFLPKDPNQPSIQFELGTIQANWNDFTESFSGSFAVRDGLIQHAPTELELSNLSGLVTIQEGKLIADSFTGSITGNPFVASLQYDIESTDGEITFSGAVSNIHEMSLADSITDTYIAGDLIINRAKAVKQGDRYLLDIDIDATQAALDYVWWFAKPPGVGLKANLKAEINPGKALIVDLSGEVASSQLTATVTMTPAPENDFPWSARTARAHSNHLDVTAVGMCLRLPYRITGGIVTDGKFHWERDQQSESGWQQQVSGYIDEISLLPLADGATIPLQFRNATISSKLITGYESTAHLTVLAEDASMPSFGEAWFTPLDRTNARGIPIPTVERNWTYDLSATTLSLPPWKATNFRGKAYSDSETTGLESYSAEIDDGSITGTYHGSRAAHSFSSSIRWTDVPTHYFIEHLNFPEVLTGMMSGEIEYSLDRDDPNTLKGEGNFSVRDGQFSADYLGSLLEERMGNELDALPPSLKFSTFTATVELDKDIIRTPSVQLDSDGFSLTASGNYVREGDMSYSINVAVSPAVAEQMPMLNDSLNVKGFRALNQDIPLGFRIEGPTFNPQGQLEKLPSPGVTLVAGAFEGTSQVIDVIDFPRKLLVVLLKTAGSLVGAGK